MIEVRVPDEQEGTKAVVRAWLKQVGDAIAENDPLVELETDQVTQEVPAPAAEPGSVRARARRGGAPSAARWSWRRPPVDGTAGDDGRTRRAHARPR